MLLLKLSDALERYIEEHYKPEQIAAASSALEKASHRRKSSMVKKADLSAPSLQEPETGGLLLSAIPDFTEDKEEIDAISSHFGFPPEGGGAAFAHMPRPAATLDERIRNVDKGFSETLLDLIDERGMKDSECYKRANVDRRLFSHIRSNPAYRPRKETALAFCVALRLSPEEADSLLNKAGYALSGSSLTDVIVQFYLEQRVWDIFEINDALFKHDQPILGSN